MKKLGLVLVFFIVLITEVGAKNHVLVRDHGNYLIERNDSIFISVKDPEHSGDRLEFLLAHSWNNATLMMLQIREWLVSSRIHGQMFIDNQDGSEPIEFMKISETRVLVCYGVVEVPEIIEDPDLININGEIRKSFIDKTIKYLLYKGEK